MLDKYEILRINVTMDNIIMKIYERMNMINNTSKNITNVNLIEHILLSLFGPNIKQIFFQDDNDNMMDEFKSSDDDNDNDNEIPIVELKPSDEDTDNDEMMINLCNIFEKDIKKCNLRSKNKHIMKNITDNIEYDIYNEKVDLNIDMVTIDMD